MTVVTSRGGVGFTMSCAGSLAGISMSENRTRVCVDTNSYAIFYFAWGMLKTRVSIIPPDFCVIEGLEAS